MWAILGGSGIIIVVVLSLYTPKAAQKVPQNFVCVPETLPVHVQRASVIVRGTIEGVLPGSPYADVWVRPSAIYKGEVEKFVRFAAWPKAGAVGKIGDLQFATGTTEYLFYFRPLHDGTLTTSSCYGTRTITGELTEGEQAVLGAGTKR
jgi:hypothetical protein